MSVSDNGKKPFEPSVPEGTLNGIGLTNTRARLQQLYGEQQSFNIGQGALGGWTVEIKIPFRAAPQIKATS
jgi:sensor histidine kinase YesM